MFELLAVLSVVGIVMVVLLGSYNSWGNAHAVTGAADIMAAGLAEAKSLARQSHRIVCFSYSSQETNDVKTVTSFQPFFCTNVTGSANEELPLSGIESAILQSSDGADLAWQPAAPEQRLSGAVRLAHVWAGDGDRGENDSRGQLFFRPDGSAFSREASANSRAQYIRIATAEKFSTRTAGANEPLYRILRIDFATGQVSLLKNESISVKTEGE